MVLDGGPCAIGVESTVISVVDPGVALILRPGAVTADDLRAALARQSRPIAVRREAGSVASPGTLKHHYMPEAPLALAPSEASLDWVLANGERELGRKPRRAVELALASDPLLAARELYAEMRRICENGADLIWTRERPVAARGGLWEAIDDRLERAATYDWRGSSISTRAPAPSRAQD
jgi:L-threonylcarbamoyladenylate synthase